MTGKKGSHSPGGGSIKPGPGRQTSGGSGPKTETTRSAGTSHHRTETAAARSERRRGLP